MPQSRNVNHRGPAQTRVIDQDVILLRKLDTKKMGNQVMNQIANTRLGGSVLEGEQDWFLDGYVAADQPRDSLMAQLIGQHTTGFAIARADSGELLATFPKKDFKRADSIARNARVELAVDIALRESESESDDDDATESPQTS